MDMQDCWSFPSASGEPLTHVHLNCLNSLFSRESICCSHRLPDLYVTILICYKDVYVNSFFPGTARLWNSLPIECFPLTYDQKGFKSRINIHLLTVDSF